MVARAAALAGGAGLAYRLDRGAEARRGGVAAGFPSQRRASVCASVHLSTCSPRHPGCREGPSSACLRGPEPPGLQSCVVSVHRCGEETCAHLAEQKGSEQAGSSRRHTQAGNSPAKGHAHPGGTSLLLLLSRCPWDGRQKLHWPFRRTRRRRCPACSPPGEWNLGLLLSLFLY